MSYSWITSLELQNVRDKPGHKPLLSPEISIVPVFVPFLRYSSLNASLVSGFTFPAQYKTQDNYGMSLLSRDPWTLVTVSHVQDGHRLRRLVLRVSFALKENLKFSKDYLSLSCEDLVFPWWEPDDFLELLCPFPPGLHIFFVCLLDSCVSVSHPQLCPTQPPPPFWKELWKLIFLPAAGRSAVRGGRASHEGVRGGFTSFGDRVPQKDVEYKKQVHLYLMNLKYVKIK